MLIWIIALVLILGASALIARLVAVGLLPEVTDAFVNGDEVSALVLGAVTIAMMLIVFMALVVGPLSYHGDIRQRIARSKPVTAWRQRQLRSNATTSPEPVLGVKLANVHWSDPDTAPHFSGASGGNAYQREDIAHCDNRQNDTLCFDQRPDHRCGFYAVTTGPALLAELTATPEQQAVERYDWRDALEPFEPTTHVVTVALHGEVMVYNPALRAQRQTVTGIDLPATCGAADCHGSVDAVAAVGYPLGLCAPHASSPELVASSLPLDEFARRFDIALRPTTPTGQPVPRPDHTQLAPVPQPSVDEQEQSLHTPVEHRGERVEGWLSGSFDLERGQFVAGPHRLTVDTHVDEPITAAREAGPPSPGEALARLRLGGEVVVRRGSVSSQDVQIWDLYLPATCQHADCDQRGELVDRDGSLAVTRCLAHAGPAARPAEQHSADHGMAIQLTA